MGCAFNTHSLSASCRHRPWIQLRRKLLDLFESQTDSLRFYFFGEDEAQKTEHHGVRPPLDVSGPLLV